MKWLLWIDGQASEPLEGNELHALLQSGKISPQVLARRHNQPTAKWQPLAQVVDELDFPGSPAPLPVKDVTDSVRLRCHQCLQHLEASPENSGQSIECPACGASIDIPTLFFHFRAEGISNSEKGEWYLIWITSQGLVIKSSKAETPTRHIDNKDCDKSIKLVPGVEAQILVSDPLFRLKLKVKTQEVERVRAQGIKEDLSSHPLAAEFSKMINDSVFRSKAGNALYSHRQSPPLPGSGNPGSLLLAVVVAVFIGVPLSALFKTLDRRAGDGSPPGVTRQVSRPPAEVTATTTTSETVAAPAKGDSAPNEAPPPAAMAGNLRAFKDMKTFYFECQYPASWRVNEMDDSMNRRVQFITSDAEIRVRIPFAEGRIDAATPDLSAEAERLFPVSKGRLLSKTERQIAGLRGYEIEYRQFNPPAHNRAAFVVARGKLHIIMLACVSESSYVARSAEFDSFLRDYKPLFAESSSAVSGSVESAKNSPGQTGERTGYRDPKGRFTCQPPPGWKATENRQDPRSRVRFSSGANEISIIAREMDSHVFDESVRAGIERTHQDIVNQVTGKGGNAQYLGASWKDIRGTRAVQSEVVINSPRPERIRFVRFKRDGRDHSITLTVKSSQIPKQVGDLFEQFLSDYQTIPLDGNSPSTSTLPNRRN